MEIFISTWISSVLKWIEAQFVSDGDDIFIIIWSKWFLVICGSGFPCGCFSFFSSGGAMRLPRLPRGDKELRREEAEALWKIVPKLSVSISSASPPVSTGRRCDRSAIFETDIIGSGQHMAPSAAPKWSGVISTLILWQWTWWAPLPPPLPPPTQSTGMAIPSGGRFPINFPLSQRVSPETPEIPEQFKKSAHFSIRDNHSRLGLIYHPLSPSLPPPHPPRPSGDRLSLILESP